MVPKNATKATNATLYQNRRFWAPGPKTRILGFRPNECELSKTFLFGKSLEVSGGIGNIIRPISGRSAEISTQTWWWPTSQKFKKCDFFSIFSKFVLDDSRYQIRLPNHSRTPKMSFSGHISISQTISATLRKIDFLIWKILKVPMCAFCHFLRYEAIFCSMWPKIWNMFWNLFSRPQRYFWIPMTQAFDV